MHLPTEIIALVAGQSSWSTLQALRQCSRRSAYACELIFKARFHIRYVDLTASSLTRLAYVSMIEPRWPCKLVRKLVIATSVLDSQVTALNESSLVGSAVVRHAIRRYTNVSRVVFVDSLWKEQHRSLSKKAKTVATWLLSEIWGGLALSKLPLTEITSRSCSGLSGPSQVPLPVSALSYIPPIELLKGSSLQTMSRLSLFVTLKGIHEVLHLVHALNCMTNLTHIVLRVDDFDKAGRLDAGDQHLLNVKLADGLFRELAKALSLPQLQDMQIKSPVDNISWLTLLIANHAPKLQGLHLRLSMPCHHALKEMSLTWAGLVGRFGNLKDFSLRATWYHFNLDNVEQMRHWSKKSFEHERERMAFFDDMLEELDAHWQEIDDSWFPTW